jgi:6-pyruvoyltetrahydropterin/6-carboxytetrahydropterin synthase
MWTITRDYWFSAAHRLEGHPKCGRLHGHNYKVVVELTGDIEGGRWIMDFGDLDQIVKPIIASMDHRYLLSDENETEDPYAQIAYERRESVYLPIVATTAECIAQYIYQEILLKVGRHKIAVTVWETPKSSARYAPD